MPLANYPTSPNVPFAKRSSTETFFVMMPCDSA